MVVDVGTTAASVSNGSGLWPLRRSYCAPALTIRRREFRWGTRTFVMGIINVTPDSFSGDGTGGDPGTAAALAQRMEVEGADLLDIGAESSRPGARLVTPEEELARLLPSLEAVRAVSDLPISVDTYHAQVAEVALAHGADWVNDILGFRGDGAMAGVVAAAGAAAVVMHNQRGREHRDVAADIRAGLGQSLEIAAAAGVPASRLVGDPGFGFGWEAEQNLELLRRLPELWELGLPLLVGTSRKSTIGVVLDVATEERMEGTAATVAVAIAGGADIVRVHDVGAMSRVARMTDAIVRGNQEGP
ncbi:MAG: dihydropteroate synthase [Dehalococcoidia bacterium]